MRALVVDPGPQFSVKDVYDGLIGGLRSNGVDVRTTPFAQWLDFFQGAYLKNGRRYRKAFTADDPVEAIEMSCLLATHMIFSSCWQNVPDVVIVVSSFFLPPEFYMNIRERGKHVVLWLTESPYEDARQIPMARYADTVIVNDPKNIDAFRKHNPRTFYIPHAYDPAVHHNNNRTNTHDFSFVGTGYESRVEFFEKVDWPGTPVFAGNWQHVTDDSPLLPFLADERGQCIDNGDAADLYRASKTSANLYRKETMSDADIDGWAVGPREIELAATGTWFAREPRGEGDDLFPMLPTFTEPGELSEQLRWALAHPRLRQKAADAAREAIVDRTFHNNAQQLLKLMGA